MKKPIASKPAWLIWIDQEKAILLHTVDNGQIIHEELHAPHESRERFGGEDSDKTGSFGTTIDHQKKNQQRERTHQQQFLHNVASHVLDPASVTIMGPGQTRHALQHVLEADHRLQGKPIVNHAAGKMTMPMLKSALANCA